MRPGFAAFPATAKRRGSGLNNARITDGVQRSETPLVCMRMLYGPIAFGTGTFVNLETN